MIVPPKIRKEIPLSALLSRPFELNLISNKSPVFSTILFDKFLDTLIFLKYCIIYFRAPWPSAHLEVAYNK